MKRKKTAGFILISVYVVFLILVILIIGFTSRSIREVDVASRQNRRLQALYLAEAGIDSALEWIRDSASSHQPGIWINLGAGSFRFTVSNPGGILYTVNSMGSILGREDDQDRRIITATFADDHYARYTYFSDSEQYSGSNVWFVDGDVLRGPVQTNGRFNMKGNYLSGKHPVFEGQVKCASDVLRFYNDGSPFNASVTSNSPYDVPDFQQGIELGADAIPLPASAVNLRNAAGASGLFLTGETTIVFNADGTINVTNSDRAWNNYNLNVPDNGAIFVDSSTSRCNHRYHGYRHINSNGTLHISGTVNGGVSVGASSDVYVTDNILYNDDPRVNPDSRDKLGIIAERNVIVSDSAPHNLEIDASIMALGTSFTVENYWTGLPKGTLSVYGGIIQENRGPVGTFSGSTGEKLSGYSKNYQYDSRLRTSPPPYNPTTGDYIMTSWKEEEPQ